MRRQTSRLTRLEEKRNIRKAALLVTGTAVVAILGITIGVKVLARIAGFSNTQDLRDNRSIKTTISLPVLPCS